MSKQTATQAGVKFNKKTVRDIDVNNKQVLVRVDYNVPVDKDNNISDDSRIRASLPTIQYLVEHNAKVILCSHFGRPKGKVVESMRLAPMARRLSELLNKPVKALNNCVGLEVEKTVASMNNGDVIMLENLRFHPEEEANDPQFARSLSRLADIYVDDAFRGCSPRPCIGNRSGPIFTGGSRIPDGKRAHLFGTIAGKTGPSLCGCHGRS